jgi:hypothetical protein
MPDARTEASRARALVGLVVERNRLREAIEAETESIETCALFGIPTTTRRLDLLKSELAELSPTRRPAIPTTEGDEP